NFDSFVVGTYRRRDGRLANYRTAYFKSYATSGGTANQTPLLELLITNRVPVRIDQQAHKGLASTLTLVIPVLMSIAVLAYFLFSWRRGSGPFSRRGRQFRHDAPDVTFGDIAGQATAVAELREIAEYLADPGRFASVGSTIPRGVLLYGPPGSGKTLLARALAGEVGAAFYYVSGAEFVEMYVGVGASRVRSLFDDARATVPSIIFIDELDAIGQRRAADDTTGGPEQEQALNQILTEMDGFVGSEGIIVVAATNRPDVLDPALLRPGRFDRSIGLERTDEAGRLEILRLHARGRPLAADADLAGIARQAVGLTGAELASLVNEAGLLTARAGEPEISNACLEEALRRVREAPERRRRLAMRGSSPGRQVLSDEQTSFADVAGLENVIEELREIETYLDEPEAFTRMGARAPSGHLLVGPPGSGKTMLVRALAYEASAAFFWVSASEFTERYTGVGAARVRDLFAEARAMAPAIVFIDEIDAIGSERGAATGEAARETDTTLNQILIELDGFTGSEGVVVMGATNRPEILDPALVRPGRFDRTITLDLPHLEARRDILRVHARSKPLSPEVDLHALAGATSGFSGADLANLLNEAALLAIRRRRRQIGEAEIGEAMDRVLLGVAGTHRLNDEQRTIVAYHEAGHAVLGHELPGARIPHRVSVIPRGRRLGAVLTRDEGDRLLMTRSMLLDEMAALLGGHTAEDLVFGEVSSAAGEDLQRVNLVARQMVVELGMSAGLGVVAYGDDGRGAGARIHSEETARRVDEEVARIVREAQARARDVLERSRAVLDRVAAAVAEREILTAEELEAILAGARTPSASR
ncbi:MAG TPA: AAA family ATPase, partial [Solirubrobacteraceae bacterium]|nr:AAA family ATPase [Solirubrobacteraceae bacterium]